MEQTKPRLIGVSGTAGAGKDAVADIICRLYGGENLSTGDCLRAVARFVYRLPADNNPVREQLYTVGTFLRSEVDPAATVKICILQARLFNIRCAVLSGLRTTGEADAIKADGGIIIGVDAKPRLRYERQQSRQRDVDAHQTFEEFIERDEHENRGYGEAGSLRGIRAIISSADVAITNDGTLEDLERQIRKKIDPLLAMSNH